MRGACPRVLVPAGLVSVGPQFGCIAVLGVVYRNLPEGESRESVYTGIVMLFGWVARAIG